jgi:dolichol-phosphate mannosyltransferase
VIANRLLAGLVTAQLLLGLRVLRRFVMSAGGTRIRIVEGTPAMRERITIVVPVLDELDRLGPCLDGLLTQGSEVAAILVVDGGSVDGTPDLVRRYTARDGRVRLIEANPVPAGWNGKAWGLQVGVREADPTVAWILCVDADVRVASLLSPSLLAHAARTGLSAFSVATRQEVSGPGQGLIHPVMLTTLVYRFGLPGQATVRVSRVQANGQCFLARRDVLERSDAIAAARASRCEDVTIARCLAAHGVKVGFFEAADLAWVAMYPSWRAAWRNWPRSLPMWDQYRRLGSILGLIEVTLVQALPAPLAVLLKVRGRNGRGKWMLGVNAALVAVRLGVLCGTARAYRWLPWTYWLSPLSDLPVALRIWMSLIQRRHTWRGRPLVTGSNS